MLRIDIYIMEKIKNIRKQYAHQKNYLQAVDEVLESVLPYLQSINASQEDLDRLMRLLEPERIITFRVQWMNDAGQLQQNTGYRVQFSSVLGPYKGGLRFDATVDEDILKFLAFEQTFKNALTGLPLGSGKGGSNFDPRGKSENEIRSFSRAFMVELSRHIGIEVDVPAGDIGVGGREIGYMMGMYKELTGGKAEGVLTGKPVTAGGSLGRTEATGYGVVYFVKAMLERDGVLLSGQRVAVSGSGNVAEYTVRKLIAENAIVVSVSDRGGYIYKKDGFSHTDIDNIFSHKHKKLPLSSLLIQGSFYANDSLWRTIEADIYLPCATQNEIGIEEASYICKYAKYIVEGANMPLTNEAINLIHSARIPHAPGKASNAGGVAVSGLEMVQNTSHYYWTEERVDNELQLIMRNIHNQCCAYGQEDWGINYVKGANIAGAMRVLAGMKSLGW
jgi:glutamate dehydrogenase (NADP+)